MPNAIFKTSRKKLFLMIFGVVFFALSFWLVQPAPKAEAACSVGCKQDGANCYFDVGNAVFADKVCINGLATEKDYWTWNAACSSGSNKCQQNICQGGAVNGSVCSIIENRNGSCDTPGNFIRADGNWESSSSSCVQCSGVFKIYQLANPAINKIDILDVFSTACGAIPACQGLTLNADCNPPAGGKCNSSGVCVAAAGGALNVSAVPNTITANTAIDITFAVTSGSTPITGATVSISGVETSGSCNTGGGVGTCTLYGVKATSAGTINVTAVRSPYTSGSTTITVQPVGALIVTANPNTVTIGTPINITIFVKDASNNVVSNATIVFSGGSSKNCTTGGGGFCSINSVNATGNITVTATDPVSGSTGTTTITAFGSVCTAGTCKAGDSSVWCFGGSWTSCMGGRTCQPGGTCGFTGAVTIVNCINCAAGSGGECVSRKAAGMIWAVAPNCATDPDIASICSGDNVSCQIGLSNGTTCSCGGSAPPPVVTPTCAAGDGCKSTGCTPPDPDCPVAPAASCSGPSMFRSPITFCNVQDLITGATDWILGLVASVIILILVYGGIMYTTSAGDEERIRSAKNTILYAIIGLGIILISYSIITEVKSIFKIP